MIVMYILIILHLVKFMILETLSGLRPYLFNLSSNTVYIHITCIEIFKNLIQSEAHLLKQYESEFS